MMAIVMASLVLAVLTAQSAKHSSVTKDDIGAVVLLPTSYPPHLYSNFTPRLVRLAPQHNMTILKYSRNKVDISTHPCLKLLDTWIYADSPAIEI